MEFSDLTHGDLFVIVDENDDDFGKEFKVIETKERSVEVWDLDRLAQYPIFCYEMPEIQIISNTISRYKA